MDIKLYNGDFVKLAGGVQMVSGKDELLQQALIRLSVRQGSFAPMPSLGSRLHTLKALSGNLSADARALANEALLPMGLEVESVLVSGDSETLRLEFFLGRTGESVTIEV